MKPATIFLFTLSLFTLNACTPDTQDNLSPDLQPVVQGYLTPGQPISVQVTKQIPFVADTTGQGEPINGLTLSISTSGKAYTLRATGSGAYVASPDLVVKTGPAYQLDFDYSGRHVSGSTVIPSHPVSFSADQTVVYRTAITVGGGMGGFGGAGAQAATPIRLTWLNPIGDYYFVVVDNIETSPVEIITRQNGGTTQAANRRFRSQPVQSDFTTIQAQSFQYFGRHRVVLFHLNPDYAALYKQNSTSTQNISTPPTTLTNGLGLFTGINTDTLYVNVKQQ